MRTERGKTSMIKFSVPGKIHLLGEHAVVYGKPALLAAIDLRVTVSITPSPQDIVSKQNEEIKKIIEPIVKKRLNIKTIPSYNLTISSQIPIGSGLGSSAAVSAAYIAALLSLLNVKWDLEDVSNLAYEAEKVFHGNPSGADNSTVIFGGLIWFRRETPDLKIIHPLPFTIHPHIKQFTLIDSGKPVESTREMVEKVRIKLQESRWKRGSPRAARIKVQKIFDDQERLVKELVAALREGDRQQLVNIIRQGERNLERLGVVGKKAQQIIRLVEKVGGAAKIMGGGGIKDGSGMLLAYHKNPQALLALAKKHHLSILSITLAEAGLLQVSSAPVVDFWRK